MAKQQATDRWEGHRFNRLTVLGYNAFMRKQQILLVAICDCGRIIATDPSNIISGRQQSCGCLHHEIVIKRRGTGHPMYGRRNELSPRWKGGSSPVNQRERGSYEFREWRNSVFVRDNYTCQRCQQHGWQLQAHHIASFDTNLGLRYNIHNGITLCKECHLKFHQIYGRGNNDIWQLVEWMYYNNI